MSDTHICPMCEEGVMEEVTYAETVKSGRRRVRLEGLRKYHCPHCEGDTFSTEHLDIRTSALEEALKLLPDAITREMLVGFRMKHGLSQREASELFGAGGNSFAKWESGQSMAGPSALLLQCAMHIPEVLPFLRGISASTGTVDTAARSLSEKSVIDAMPITVIEGLFHVHGKAVAAPDSHISVSAAHRAPVWSKQEKMLLQA